MKKAKISAILVTLAMAAAIMPTGIAADTSYTFSGFVKATTGGTDDIENVPLTSNITVTTGGKTNYKNAGITTHERNNEFGTYPIDEAFTAAGSYIYLGTASSNNDTEITLNMPEIKKSSKVEITYAKPVVTNNGSTRRNENDPYAYLEIGDRFLCINGGEFNTWRTESVITGEDTNKIVFHGDKWAAIAIEKIDISDATAEPLHTLTLESTHYANFTVDGYKCTTIPDSAKPFTAASKAVIPSLEAGKTVTVTASKDGYTTVSKEITIGDSDITKALPLTYSGTDGMEYYESDFGNVSGTYSLTADTPIEDITSTKGSATAIYANVTLDDNAAFTIKTASGKDLLTIKNSNGLYANDKLITTKDNMEFSLYWGDELILKQNDTETVLGTPAVSPADDTIGAITGIGTTIDYIGIKSLPANIEAPISGPDKVSANSTTQYSAKPEFTKSGSSVIYSISPTDGVSVSEDGILSVDPTASGTIKLYADHDGTRTEKDIEIVSAPKIRSAVHDGYTLNLYQTARFELSDCVGEYDNAVSPTLKDFKSSDPSVITIDENGNMYAAGTGTTTISVNAYTGTDNILTYKYTVERFAINGITEAAVSYTPNDFAENEHTVGWKINFADGTSEDITPTDIPAAAVSADGTVITSNYTADGKLAALHKQDVKKGDIVPVSNGTKLVYLVTDGKFTKLTDPDTTVKGFTISHAIGTEYEIDPIYRYDNIGDVKDNGLTLDAAFADGFYDMTFKKAETRRGDIFVNGYMVGNNVDQADADRKVTDGALYTAEDIKVKNGTINVSMTDGSTMLDYVEFTKHPSFYDRQQRVYIIGDSLACIYYGSFEQEVGGGRAGWGQQLPDYLKVPVTDLANSGQYAAGLYRTAFPSVIENGEEGDILLIECAYNDRNYSTRSEMTECVKDMIRQCREVGITPILVTPNASKHDYKPSVAWSSYLLDIAADTGCQYIDLSKESYDFLYSLYGDDKDNVVTMNYNLTAVGGDTLHSSYAGAYKWASIVAQGLKTLGYGDIVNTEFKYEFTDTLGNNITAQVK